MKCNHASVSIQIDLWRAMLTQGHLVIAKILQGIPPDAQFVRTWYNERQGMVYFVFAHPTFQEIDTTDIPPIIDVVYDDLSNKTLLDLCSCLPSDKN